LYGDSIAVYNEYNNKINNTKMSNQIQYINPDGLSKNPAFSQIMTTQGNGKTIYIGGQDSVNNNGEIIGKGNIAAQTEQVMKNLQIALTACGATFDNLVKLSIYMVYGQNIYSEFQVSQKYFGNLKNSPAISVLIVAGLANPDFLVEIDATAFIPEK
jgi:enamine deaminase RidA (YjgF/YER057c/UK114 family)